MQLNKKIKIGELYTRILVICISGFLGFSAYLPGAGILYSNDYMYIVIIGCVCVSLLISTMMQKQLIARTNLMMNGLALIAIVCLEVCISLFRWHQSIVVTAKEAMYFVAPVIAFLAFLQYSHRNKFDKYVDLIVKVSLLSSLVAIIAFFLYSLVGIDILRLTTSRVNLRFRNGTIRFFVGGVIFFAGVIISFSRRLSGEKNRIDTINLVLGALHLIVIYKTRTVIAYMIITILISILLEKKLHRAIRGFVIFVIIILMVLSFFIGDSINESFNGLITNDAGIAIRLRAIEYFMKQFFSSPIMGMGFLTSNQDPTGQSIDSATTGFYRSDVGVVGVLNQFGLVGIIWLICFFKLCFRSIEINQEAKKVNKIIIRNILIYLMISLINLAFLTTNLSMYIFLVYVLIYTNNCSNIED